jgi:hypothetical protein
VPENFAPCPRMAQVRVEPEIAERVKSVLAAIDQDLVHR